MTEAVHTSPLVQYLTQAPAIEIVNGPVYFRQHTLIEMEIPEDEEEDFALSFEWATTDGDTHGIYLTEAQALAAKDLGEGSWEVEGTSEPDFVGESVETFQIRAVQLAPFIV